MLPASKSKDLGLLVLWCFGTFSFVSVSFLSGVGMVLEWEQPTGLLYASGDVRHIRVWDTHKELMVQDIPTKADSSVTCLTSDSAERSLLIAGCGDGTVRLYDRRQPPHSRYVHRGMTVWVYGNMRMTPPHSVVQTLREHQGWIVNVLMQQYCQERSIVSCRYISTCSAGVVSIVEIVLRVNSVCIVVLEVLSRPGTQGSLNLSILLILHSTSMYVAYILKRHC